MEKVEKIKKQIMREFEKDLDRYFSDDLHSGYGSFVFEMKVRDYDVTVCEGTVTYQKKVKS